MAKYETEKDQNSSGTSVPAGSRGRDSDPGPGAGALGLRFLQECGRIHAGIRNGAAARTDLLRHAGAPAALR